MKIRLSVLSSWRWSASVAVLVLAWLAYAPGLSGGFLFDDFVNLNLIGATGPVDDWPTFWRYITSGSADPTGRPLSLLSFLLETRDWPAQPWPFLRDNLILHCCNGALLFALLARLGRGLGESEPQAKGVALLAAGMWLLHPLFVSTTLYIVQRHAMLPTTFTLLGLLAWVHGRERLLAGDGTRGTAWMIAGLAVGTLLATASKANGVLLPLFALVLESTVLPPPSEAAGAAKSRLLLLRATLIGVPVVALSIYFAQRLPGLSSPVASRNFTPLERLLTESRVIWDYLGLMVAPRAVSSGLFNDAYPVSRNLLEPWTTLPSLLAIVASLVGAVRWRRRTPVLSAAVLFFFAGHVLESTIVPLELYFEHRNYLPTMLLFWPVALAIARWQKPASLRAAVACALLLLLAAITWQRSSLWGSPDRLAALWALKLPESSRAQAAAAIAEANAGRAGAARVRLEPMWRSNPYDLQLAFNYISVRCQLDGIDAETSSRLAEALRRTPRSELMTNQWLSSAVEVAARHQCAGFGIDEVASWVDAALENPVIRDPRVRLQDIEPVLARIALVRHQPRTALQHFDRALRASPSPDTAARQAAMLADSGYYVEAIAHLDVYESLRASARKPAMGMPSVHAWVLERQGYWPREMAHLRSGLRREIDAGEKAP